MSNVLITGTGRGIGRETAILFLERGYTVHGIDIRPSSIENKDYHHHVADVSEPQSLPDIASVDILINAQAYREAGTTSQSTFREQSTSRRSTA